MIDEIPTLFARMSALADPLRGRIVLVLERNELTVSEICAVFRLPQSTTSRQLKTLADEGWLRVRAEGTSRHYSAAIDRLPPEIGRLWRVVRDQVVAIPAADEDAERLREVLHDRRSRSQAFFSTAAGEWDRMRSELVGRRLDLLALLGLLDDSWIVGDLGCGTGQVSDMLAPFVRQVVAIDDSEAMLSAARARLARHPNVTLRTGAIEALPIEEESLDAAILFLVLHHVTDPGLGLREVARVLKPGGRLLIVDLRSHLREDYRQSMGHLWMGFESPQLEQWVSDAGMDGFRYLHLPGDPDARGPMLFAATARAGEPRG